MIKIFLCLILLLLNCGPAVLQEVANFSPNTKPSITSISLKTSQNTTFTSGSEILPGDVFFLEYNIPELEGNIISVEYTSKIGNSAAKLVFNNQQLDNTDVNLVKATATIIVPDKDNLPLNKEIYFTIIATDGKGAQTFYDQYLGPVKGSSTITQVSAPNAPYSEPLIVQWQANSKGFYQKYAVASTATSCTINTSELVYNYTKDTQIITTLYTFGSNKKFCIVMFDALNQTAVLEYLLP